MIGWNQLRCGIFHSISRFQKRIVFAVVQGEEQEAEAGADDQGANDRDKGEHLFITEAPGFFGFLWHRDMGLICGRWQGPQNGDDNNNDRSQANLALHIGLQLLQCSVRTID